MIDDELQRLVRIAAALNAEGVRYVVFGAVAVNLHGLVRSTEDYDFFVAPEPENVAAIKRALRTIWDDPLLDEVQDEDMIGDYPSFEYTPPDGSYSMDFVSRLGEAFTFADLQKESMVREVYGVPIRIATPQMLHRMKRSTVRPKDRIDAEALRQMFNIPEE